MVKRSVHTTAPAATVLATSVLALHDGHSPAALVDRFMTMHPRDSFRKEVEFLLQLQENPAIFKLALERNYLLAVAASVASGMVREGQLYADYWLLADQLTQPLAAPIPPARRVQSAKPAKVTRSQTASRKATTNKKKAAKASRSQTASLSKKNSKATKRGK
jgi:hypothetical protein